MGKRPHRAAEWAIEWGLRNALETHSIISQSSAPAILGACINLGTCLDFLDVHGYRVLRRATEFVSKEISVGEIPEPLRPWDYHRIDCLAINAINDAPTQFGLQKEFDTIRGCFPEGMAVMPYSAIKSKTHIQLCVRNPKCIIGYFRVKNTQALIKEARERLISRYTDECAVIKSTALQESNRLVEQCNALIAYLKECGTPDSNISSSIKKHFDKQWSVARARAQKKTAQIEKKIKALH